MFGFGMDVPEEVFEDAPEGVGRMMVVQTYHAGYADGVSGSPYFDLSDEHMHLQDVYGLGYERGQRETALAQELNARPAARQAALSQTMPQEKQEIVSDEAEYIFANPPEPEKRKESLRKDALVAAWRAFALPILLTLVAAWLWFGGDAMATALFLLALVALVAYAEKVAREGGKG